jgi:hypothetical protein
MFETIMENKGRKGNKKVKYLPGSCRSLERRSAKEPGM